MIKIIKLAAALFVIASLSFMSVARVKAGNAAEKAGSCKCADSSARRPTNDISAGDIRPGRIPARPQERR
jgi:hypothetical protein